MSPHTQHACLGYCEWVLCPRAGALLSPARLHERTLAQQGGEGVAPVAWVLLAWLCLCCCKAERSDLTIVRSALRVQPTHLYVYGRGFTLLGPAWADALPPCMLFQ